MAFPLILFCILSGFALAVFNIPYSFPGGLVFEKIHPGTYFACLGAFILYVTGSGPAIDDVVFRGRYRLSIYFIGLLLLFLYGVTLSDVQPPVFIDNWFLPAVFLMSFAALSKVENVLVGRVIDLFMCFNSLLGLVETGTNWRLVPLSIWSGVIGQWLYPFDWRATALLGHPLTNSYVVGSYLLSLLITNRIRSLVIRLPLMGLHLLALSAFGSRSAAVLFGVALLVYMLYGLLAGLVTRRIGRDVLVYLGTVVVSIVLVIPALLSSGFLDRYLDRFGNDGGSAHARNLAYDLISTFSLSDLLIGPPVSLVFSTEKRYGIIALESFWLDSLVTFGVIGCCLFFPLIYWLCRCVIRQGGRQTAFILIYFFSCCTTSLSLGSKNAMFSIVIAICLTNGGAVPARVRRLEPRRAERPLQPEFEPAG